MRDLGGQLPRRLGLKAGSDMRVAAILVFAGILTLASGSHPVASQDYAELEREFDARILSDTEKRVLQLGLTLDRSYRGLLDGRWGAGSQAALEHHAAANDPRSAAEGLVYNYHAAALAVLAIDFIHENGLAYRGDPPHSHRLLVQPGTFLEDFSTEVGDLVLYSRGIQVRTLRSDLAFAAGLHEVIAEEIHPLDEPYFVRSALRLVTSRGAGPNLIYARSDQVPGSGAWLTTMISQSTGADRRLLDVVAAGITMDAEADIQLTDGQLLALVRSGIEVARAPRQPPQPAPQPPVSDPPALSTGTAFFVNNTDLVTAKHVVEGCGSILLTDGTKLEVFSEHPTLDLALLISPQRSREWIPVHLTGEAKLGQRVNALGYPYFGTIGTALNTTGGNVSALLGLDDDPRMITISAPVQPGNSGGPLLAQDGTVIGVVVSRLGKRVMAELTGTLPENINYAVTGKELLVFLEAEGVSLPRIGEAKIDLDEGIPDGMQRAVVPVICEQW